MKTRKIGVIGAGAWGSALACIAARNGHETVLWSRNPDQVSQITETHRNSAYLGDLEMASEIVATGDLEVAVGDADYLLLAVPTQSLRKVVSNLDGLPLNTALITTCKGIERQSMLLPTQIVRSELDHARVGCLSGPSFAHDVVSGLPTAVTVADETGELADEIATQFSTATFRCYSSNDVIGVELGGALKNVLALAVGAARGMALGASAEAALIARGFAEINRLAIAMGARPETLSGLSGLGDITLTCSSSQSRNFSYGRALGSGQTLEGLKLAEGTFTASVAQRLATERHVEMPITSAVVDVLDRHVTAREAVKQLLTRPLKREI